MSLWTPIILILFAMGEGSLTVQDIVRSPQMFDRLAAFGKPSRRYLFSDHSCFCPGKKESSHGKPRATAQVTDHGHSGDRSESAWTEFGSPLRNY